MGCEVGSYHLDRLLSGFRSVVQLLKDSSDIPPEIVSWFNATRYRCASRNQTCHRKGTLLLLPSTFAANQCLTWSLEAVMLTGCAVVDDVDGSQDST